MNFLNTDTSCKLTPFEPGVHLLRIWNFFSIDNSLHIITKLHIEVKERKSTKLYSGGCKSETISTTIHQRCLWQFHLKKKKGGATQTSLSFLNWNDSKWKDIKQSREGKKEVQPSCWQQEEEKMKKAPNRLLPNPVWYYKSFKNES